ncbi:phosphate ABC transporter permease subunit PstC [Pseudonocardia acidicola]|uniref:Phosphate transport system permease protein n=1 Tax=Pseudonocardia acidicola TaxID=2724939 RepID=A0ABX1SDM4_9PSEU|nr:phosphate ABC transporter permease subunit PstC [Pseudonocardia acidicola]NMH99670.1 phosphate ABC transporter permease subunit PstC [Pseudonocardia acidicola]
MDEPNQRVTSLNAWVRRGSAGRRRSRHGTPPDGAQPDRPLRTRERAHGDAVFAILARGSGALLLVIMAAIAVFLVIEAIPALAANTTNFFTTLNWDPDGTPVSFGIAAVAFGSVLTSLLALLISVPVAIGVALMTSQYAPRWLARPLGYVVDLLAAVPSVIFGLWGLIYLVPALIPLATFLNRYLGFIPLFASNGTYGKSVFAASIVLAVMVLPIVAAISREVFAQTPADHKEAAWAIGATRWEMVRTAVLPYGRSGVISATVLGFGRAIGETIAVALVLSANYEISIHILEPGGNTIAANIANRYGEAGAIGRGALIASGLVLFVITLVVNFAARAIVRRNGRGGAL